MKPTGLNTVFSTSVMTAGVVFAALGVSPDAHAQSSCGITTTRLPDGSTTTTGTPCPSPSAPTPAPGGSSSGNSTGDVINSSDVKIKQLLGMGGLGPAASQVSNCNYITGGGGAVYTFGAGVSLNFSNDAKTIPGCHEAMLKRIFVQAVLTSGSANPALTALAVYEVVGKEGLDFLKTQEGKAAMALFAVATAPTGYRNNEGAPAAPTGYRNNEGAPAPTLVVRVETPPPAQTPFVKVETPPACPSAVPSTVRPRAQVRHHSCERK
ncbi:MAG: hypothetical protein JNL76_03600 [Alphaproteobacteria bacterium]|nr:hypothetical protein [Alphaproteobacteria bacterium]